MGVAETTLTTEGLEWNLSASHVPASSAFLYSRCYWDKAVAPLVAVHCIDALLRTFLQGWLDLSVNFGTLPHGYSLAVLDFFGF